MRKLILLTLLLSIAPHSYAKKQKRSPHKQNHTKIIAEIKVTDKKTRFVIDFNKKQNMMVYKDSEKKIQKTLSKKDSQYILSEFKRLPASKASKDCLSTSIHVEAVPSDGLTRSVCLERQPRTSKAYVNFANILDLASKISKTTK